MVVIQILVKNYPPTTSLNGYLNIAIFYYIFLASQIKDENDYLECACDIERLLESEKI